MGRFVEREDRRQSLLLPESLDEHVTEDNPVHVVQAFIGELDLGALGFEDVQPAATDRPEKTTSLPHSRDRAHDPAGRQSLCPREPQAFGGWPL
jgi:hypothetical protein